MGATFTTHRHCGGSVGHVAAAGVPRGCKRRHGGTRTDGYVYSIIICPIAEPTSL